MTKGVSRDQDSGSQEDTGDQGVQRELIIQRSILKAAAVCLVLLCFLLALRTTDMALYYRSANNLTALTLEINLLKAEYTNLMLERNQLKPCPSGWQQFECSCYHRSTTWKTWEESKKQCQKTPGANLVVIESKKEQDFISGLNVESSSWIGLKRTGLGKWTWLNGTPLTTQYWGKGFPDEDQGDWNCARCWHSNGKWSNGVCSDTVKSICEMKFLLTSE